MAYNLQDSYTDNDQIILPISNDTVIAQSFTASSSYEAIKVELLLYRIGTPSNITVTIEGVSGGYPDNSPLASIEVDISSITTNSSGEWVECVFSFGAKLSNGSQYFIVVSGGYASGSDYYNWKSDSNDANYAGGTQVWSLNNRGSWNGLNDDGTFKVYSEDPLFESSSNITSNLSGSLSVNNLFEGGININSSINGEIIINEIIILGTLSYETNINGNIGIKFNILGSLNSLSNSSGYINKLIDINSEIIAASNFIGSILISIDLFSSAASSSSLSGWLVPYFDGRNDCLSSSSVSGYGTVIWALNGYSNEVAIIPVDFCILNAVKLGSNILPNSSLLGFLNREQELYSNVIQDSTLSSFLDIIPDFEAATLYYRPQNKILETMEWKTSILKARDGTEQRIKIRQSPRQHFKLNILFETNKINTKFDALIHGWQKLTWLLPIWTEYVIHTTDINHHDIYVDVDTTFADFRNNSKAIIWQSPDYFEVITVDSKTDSRLNLNANYTVLNNFTGSKIIAPVRTAYLTSSINKKRYNSELSLIELIFEVYDNINFDDYTPEINYDGFAVLNIPSFMENSHDETSDADIIVVDYETGIFDVKSYSDFNFLSQDHIFINETKQECWNFRKFLHSLNGQQKTVLIPTFRNDVVQISNIDADDIYVDIEEIGLTDNMGLNDLRTYIGFYFTDGTLIVRKIIDISKINETNYERITLDKPLNLSTILTPGDCKIGFVDKCRLASDKVELKWDFAGRNECKTRFMRVP
jgi:hypothetical protein